MKVRILPHPPILMDAWFTPEIKLNLNLDYLNLRQLTKEAQHNQLQYFEEDAATIAKRWCWWFKKFEGRELIPITYPEIPNDSPEI